MSIQGFPSIMVICSQAWHGNAACDLILWSVHPLPAVDMEVFCVIIWNLTNNSILSIAYHKLITEGFLNKVSESFQVKQSSNK